MPAIAVDRLTKRCRKQVTSSQLLFTIATDKIVVL
jgi:hypothetical protein